MTSILTKILGADRRVDAFLVKLNALFDHRHTLDRTYTKTAAYAVATTDQLVILDASGGGFTVTLPASPTDCERHKWKAKSVAGGNVTIDGNGKNIDGAGTKVINTIYQTLDIEYDSTAGQWWIL